MSKLYKNNGKRWSDEEHIQLIQELNENMTFEQLSNIHQRSITAIKSRIFIKAVNDYKNGVDIEVIYLRYILNENTFNDAQEYVKKMESKKEGEKNKEKNNKKVKKEIVKEEEVQNVEEVDVNTLLLKELLNEVREMNSIMKEFIINIKERNNE